MRPATLPPARLRLAMSLAVLTASLVVASPSAAYPERIADGPRANDQGLHGGRNQASPRATSSPAPSQTPTLTPAPSATFTPSATVPPTPTPRPTTTPTTIATPKPTASASTGVVYVATSGVDSGAGTASAPWRTIGYAVAHAPVGGTILIGPGTYAPFSVSRSGLTIQPSGAATVTVAGGTTAVVITGSNVTLRGLRITGASSQGLWLDGASNVRLERLDVVANLGHGAQIIRSTGISVVDSTFAGNAKSGLRELTGTSNDTYARNTIIDNGHDGYAYNGDGLLLQGSGAIVTGNLISRNGDSPDYEHGIYAADGSAGYLIAGNTLTGNSASGIKAGGSGTVRDNVISGSVRGLVFTGAGGTLTVTGNTIDASRWAIVVTANCDISRYRSDFNAFVRTWFAYGGTIDLPRWRALSGLDLHSS